MKQAGYTLARNLMRAYAPDVEWWKTMRNVRKSKGINGVELAKAMDVRPQRVSDWENGRYPDPRLSTLEHIASALDISVGALVSDPIGHTAGVQQKETAPDASVSAGIPPASHPPEVFVAGSADTASSRPLVANSLDDLLYLAEAAAEVSAYLSELVAREADAEHARREDAVVDTGTSAHGTHLHRPDRKAPGKGRR